jgi:hypothetical protein
MVSSISGGWAGVLVALGVAVLVLAGWVSQLRDEVKQLRGGKPEGW